MKTKMFLAAAIAAVMALSMAACDLADLLGGIGGGTEGTGGNDNGGGDTGGEGGGDVGLNGTWMGDYASITVSGSTGKITYFNPPAGAMKDAMNKGLINVGTVVWKNLMSTGTSRWSGDVLQVRYNTTSPNVAVDTAWSNGRTFTLS